jgi:DNA-binding winged helix-turn-helix (wHTH) protein/TolB-like protein/Tfp pilus assembly protein PilF
MSQQPKHFYEFGAYRLDARDHLLLRDGEVVLLPPKTFDLLLALVESSGRVLTKEELMKQVWPDSFVEEANLSHHVFTLRKALGEDGEGRYIETIPRRGYRFVAGVSEVLGEADELVVAEHSRSRIVIEQSDAPALATDYRGPERTSRVQALAAGTKRRTVLLALACCAATGALVVAVGLWKARNPKGDQTATGVKSIAVLPFKPLVADSRNESLELGMADTLITKLSGVKQLVVRPISAIRKYTGLEQDPLDAGREMGVDYVVEGNLQMEGEKVRATVRLLSVKDGRAIWTDKCDQQCSSIFELQDAVAQQIAGALALRITSDEKKQLAKHYTENVEAYQLYMKGRYFWSKFTDDGLRKSIVLFEQAIERDRDYALAYTGLAASYMVLGVNGHMAPKDSRPKAKYAVEKALELDNNLALAHQCLGGFKLFHEWDWLGAEREFKRAIELDPSLAESHELYSYLLSEQVRFDEALAELRNAQELDPVSVGVSGDYGDTLRQARRYDQAIDELHKTLEMDASYFFGHYSLGLAYAQKGLYEKANAEMNKAVSLSGSSTQMMSGLGQVYALSGKKSEAQKVIAELQVVSKQRYVSPLYIAMVYATLGENDQAFAWLEKAYDEHSCWLIELGIESCWDKIRSDPRFTDLLRRVGLPQ